MPYALRRALLSLPLLTFALLVASCGQQNPVNPATLPDSTSGLPAEALPTDGLAVEASVPSDEQVLGYGMGVTAHGHDDSSGLSAGPRIADTLELPSPRPDASVRQSLGARLGAATVLPSRRMGALSLPSNAQTSKVALKILVLSSGAGDFGLQTAKLMLSRAGIAYDVLDASSQTLGSDSLIDSAGVGRYSGVILTDNALVAQTSPGVYQSTLDAGEWAVLFEYEKAYSVRQLALFGYPGVAPEDYGLRAVAGAEGSSTSFHVTPEGKGVFSDLTAGDVPVRYAYSYPAQLEAVSGVSTQPVLQDGEGRILAVTSQMDGRERLLVTTAQNPYLLHTQFMSQGLIGWLTRGVYLGDSRRFLQVDIDDWFLNGDHYDGVTGGLQPTTFRLSASDALGAKAGQDSIRSDYPVAKEFRYAVAFNGLGANLNAPASCDAGVQSPDPLTSVSRCLSSSFDWVNHTYTHLRLDITDLNTSYSEMRKNVLVARQLRLGTNTSSVVTGEHSGLGYKNLAETDPDGPVGPKTDYGLSASNVNMLAAMLFNGYRYVASNHSIASQWDASCTVCGIAHPLSKLIFLIPRYPNSVGYYVTTPGEAVAAYNRIYGPGGTAPYYDHPLNYSEFLDKDSDISLNHVLAGEAFPTYMHQPNLYQYAPGHSLASDWIRAVLDKYGRYSTLPLKTLRWDDLGRYTQARTQAIKSGSTGIWDRAANTVALKNPVGGPVYLTGGTQSVEEIYAGRSISRLNTQPNATVVVSVQAQ